MCGKKGSDVTFLKVERKGSFEAGPDVATLCMGVRLDQRQMIAVGV